MERGQAVIVVGAGPVGLLTALGLARTGVQVTLLEAQSHISESPRAAIHFPTTVRALENLGLLADALAAGLKVWNLSVRVPSTGTVISVDNRLVAPGDPESVYNLHCGQHVLAGLAKAALERLPNVQVRWNARVIALEQHASHVVVTTETPQGSSTLQAEWLIGADGAHSAVRRLLGLPFEGHTWPERFVATNVYYDFAKHGFDPTNLVADSVDWAIIAAISRDGLWRVTYGEDAALPEETVRERIPEHYSRLLPGSEPYEISTFSSYRVHERCAPTFRVGRVMLAGDAAHVCNPCGGLGLTSGVMDATAVVDALTAVIAGDSDDAALDRYAQERRQAFLEVSSPLASNFKRILQEKDPERRAQDLEIFRHTKPAAPPPS